MNPASTLADRLAGLDLERVLDSSPTAMLLVDQEGLIVHANAAARAAMAGPEGSPLIGAALSCVLPERVDPDPQAPDASREAAALHRDAFRPSGDRYPVSVSLNPARADDDTLRIAVIGDVSEQYQHRLIVDRRVRALERSNHDLSQFAHYASHDLQEPLRMVASYTDLLGQRYSGQFDERGTKYLHYVVDGARRMQQLVRDLLTYSRSDVRALQPQALDVHRVLQAVLHDMAGAITAADASVEVAALPAVWADPGQLQIVFQCLIDNALKFRGTRPARVSISATDAGPWCRFDIADSGIGIAAADAERVFGAFERLHSRTEYPGSGLGLSIARRIVERHGGWIRVQPPHGEGATLAFTLPSRQLPSPLPGERHRS